MILTKIQKELLKDIVVAVSHCMIEIRDQKQYVKLLLTDYTPRVKSAHSDIAFIRRTLRELGFKIIQTIERLVNFNETTHTFIHTDMPFEKYGEYMNRFYKLRLLNMIYISDSDSEDANEI